MRYQGRIVEWNDERGFGFVHPNGGGSRSFLHISSFDRKSPRPQVGVLITYEVVPDSKGRLQAKSAAFVDQARHTSPSSWGNLGALLVVLLVLALGIYIGYVRLSHPGSTVQASVYKVFIAREALRENPAFNCTPAKSFCSQMTSCAEALYQQERCGAGNMDGDHDGIPCEQQWCN